MLVSLSLCVQHLDSSSLQILIVQDFVTVGIDIVDVRHLISQFNVLLALGEGDQLAVLLQLEKASHAHIFIDAWLGQAMPLGDFNTRLPKRVDRFNTQLFENFSVIYRNGIVVRVLVQICRLISSRTFVDQRRVPSGN